MSSLSCADPQRPQIVLFITYLCSVELIKGRGDPLGKQRRRPGTSFAVEIDEGDQLFPYYSFPSLYTPSHVLTRHAETLLPLRCTERIPFLQRVRQSRLESGQADDQPGAHGSRPVWPDSIPGGAVSTLVGAIPVVEIRESTSVRNRYCRLYISPAPSASKRTLCPFGPCCTSGRSGRVPRALKSTMWTR